MRLMMCESGGRWNLSCGSDILQTSAQMGGGGGQEEGRGVCVKMCVV